METITHAPSASSGFVPQLSVPVRYCLYARKSTEQDELQALSIDSQIKEMTDAAEKEGLEIVEIRRESHSAKESGQRPVFQQMIIDVKKGVFTGIIAWDPSRISRNAGDLGAIVDLMDSGRVIDIRTHGQRFSNSPNDRRLHIFCPCKLNKYLPPQSVILRPYFSPSLIRSVLLKTPGTTLRQCVKLNDADGISIM